ncbi:unnamed protein product [Durusdinium trenchii]|uniref:WW domain-containing protein n=1 Tax=Durusdinium trenchii TaxID=1381693 RepID=A0ABP0MQF3_9DINO
MVVSSVGAGDHVRRPRLLHVASASELMHGWKELHDHKTGRVYYLDTQTGHTSWQPMFAPQVRGSCASVCESRTCADWLIQKAHGFYTVEPKVQCDLAHIALLKACPQTCRNCMVADTTCGTVEPLFDCKHTGEEEMRGWSETKLRWCCEHRSTGCGVHQKLPSPFDCAAGRRGAWSTGKASWCCNVEHKGCLFNCYSQLEQWEHKWSLKKRSWCCAHQKLGCIHPGQFDCTEGVLDARHWSKVRRHYCCHMEGIGCEAGGHHTKEHTRRPENQTSWSCTGRNWPLDKIKWCCLTEKVGCKLLSSTTTTTFPDLFDCQAGLKTWEQGWSRRKKMWCCKSKHIGCPFDCRDQMDQWQVRWTAAKKTFCCATFRVGCVSLGTRPAAPAPVPAPVPSEMAPLLQPHVVTHVTDHVVTHVVMQDTPEVRSPEFHCDSNMALWSPQQRHFCCHDYGVGCLHTQPLEVQVHPEKIDVQYPQTHVFHPSAEHVFSADPFHCHSGNEFHWSSEKRHFCCAMRKIGCKFHSVLLGHQHFDCNTYDADWKTTWTEEQKHRCCHDYGVGCENWHPPALPLVRMAKDTTFDCDEGAAFPDVWSVAKRAFCCRHESKGCSDATPPRYDCHAGHNGAWSKAQTQWCCDMKNVGCGALPPKFDCGEQVAEWHQAWSVQKQRFCCDSVKVGCPKTRPWLQKLLQVETTTVHPSGQQFDCRAGVKHWKEAWSPSKAHWCCAHRGYGCPYNCDGQRSDWNHEQQEWCCEHRQQGCLAQMKYELRPKLAGPGVQSSLSMVALLFISLALVAWRLGRYRQARDQDFLAE